MLYLKKKKKSECIKPQVAQAAGCIHNTYKLTQLETQQPRSVIKTNNSLSLLKVLTFLFIIDIFVSMQTLKNILF